MGEVGEVDDLAAGEAVAGRQRDHHRLFHQVVASQTAVLAAGRSGVLEAHCEMQAPRTNACGQVVQPALLDRDAQVGIVAQDSGHRHWHNARQGAGEGADAQLTPVLRRPVRQLPIREAQTLGDDVCMR